jgi:hypothetical protein
MPVPGIRENCLRRTSSIAGPKVLTMEARPIRLKIEVAPKAASSVSPPNSLSDSLVLKKTVELLGNVKRLGDSHGIQFLLLGDTKLANTICQDKICLATLC